MRLPTLLPTLAITACLLAMLPLLALGLAHSGMLGQPLWSPTLATQAIALLVFAALATPLALRAPAPWRGWPAIAAIAALATAACAGPGPALAAALLALCCLTAGHAILLAAEPRPAEPPDELPVQPIDPAFSAATGLAALLLLLVGAATLRLPTRPVCLLIPLATAIALAAAPRLRTALRASLRPTIQAQPWPLPRALLATLILATLLFYGANAALPERFYDPLVMHLMIPTQSLATGHWSPDPARFALAYFPLGADQVFTFAAALAGPAISADTAAHLVNMLALATILLLLHRTVAELAGPRIAEPTLLLFLTTPITLLLSTTAMVENVLALLILAATRAVLLLAARPSRAPLVALALLLGAMAATKLHGLVAAAPLALAALFALHAHLRLLCAPPVLAALAAAALLGVAQYALAWFRTGNPVFPLLNDLFHSPLWPPVRFEDLRWQGHLSWRLLYRMTFDSQTYLEARNGALGLAFLLLLLPGLAAAILVPRRIPLVALLVAAVYTAVVIREIQYIRYLYPIAPLLLINCAQGLAALPRRAMPLAVALAAAFGIWRAPSAGWVLETADLRAALDPGARHAMLAVQAPTRLAVEAVNALGGRKPRVLFGGEPYGAFLEGTYLYAAWYDHTLNAALYAAATPAAVAATLAAQHPDFVIAVPGSTDPTERKVADWAATAGTRLPLPGPVALWRLTPP